MRKLLLIPLLTVALALACGLAFANTSTRTRTAGLSTPSAKQTSVPVISTDTHFQVAEVVPGDSSTKKKKKKRS